MTCHLEEDFIVPLVDAVSDAVGDAPSVGTGHGKQIGESVIGLASDESECRIVLTTLRQRNEGGEGGIEAAVAAPRLFPKRHETPEFDRVITTDHKSSKEGSSDARRQVGLGRSPHP